MALHQILEKEVIDSEYWLPREKDESTYKCDLGIFEMDPLYSELRILNWILYQICINNE
jgi:hypothetical protein